MPALAATSASFPCLTEEQVRGLDVPGPRYTSYPTVPEWQESFGPEEHARSLEDAGRAAPGEPLSLYVHVPFCREMCLYCGCNVVVAAERRMADGYLATLGQEIGLAGDRLGARRTLSRVHWGGGTPTFLDVAQLRRLWRSIGAVFAIAPGAEVSIEADPVVTTPEQLAALADLGFNRISMGVQDFDPEVQDAVGRRQGFEQTRDLVAQARTLGFASVNLDLIYGLPRQRPEGWHRTLEQVLAIRPDRVAVFSFAYVPAVRPHQRKLDAASLPRGPAKLELLRAAHDRFVAAGYRAIGMDHFAAPHDELARAVDAGTLWRDFQGYTTRSAPDTVAVGITGISAVAGTFAQNVRSRGEYARGVAAGRLPIERGLRLSADDRRRRAVITSLMCNFQVDLAAHGGADAFAAEVEDLRRLEREGLVKIEGHVLVLTALGRVFVRNVAMVFDAYLRRRGADSRPTFSRTV